MTEKIKNKCFEPKPPTGRGISLINRKYLLVQISLI